MEEQSSAHTARRVLIGRIENLAIGQTDAALGFEGRLAAENGWSEAFAALVGREYRRFIALVATAGEEITPSDAVDQAWHLHMVYTRDYWHGLCRDIVGREIHHEPTSGGEERREHYRIRYARTLELYREVFACDPPAEVWPDPSHRFAIRFRRVDLLRNALLGPSEARWTSFSLAGAAAGVVFGMGGFIAFLLAGAALALFGVSTNLEAGAVPRGGRSSSSTSDGGGCTADAGGGDGGCGGGGCGGGGCGCG